MTGQRFSLFPVIGSGTTSSTVQPSALVLVDMPTPGGGYTTQIATVAQLGAGYWSNGLSSQAAGMVSWNGSVLLTRTIQGTTNQITVNAGNGAGNPVISLPSLIDLTSITVSAGTFNSPTLVNPIISGTTYSGVTISGGTFLNGTFTGLIDATGATISGATLQGATFTGTILDSGTISGGTVSGATITGSTLSGYAFVTVGAVPATVPSGRQIAAGTMIALADSGAGGTITISVSGAGSGTVLSVATDTSLTGGPITVTGTLGLVTQAGVAPGTYTNATVSVNSRGIIESVSTGAAGGTDVLQVQIFM